jgi:hypothetical protein
MGGQAACVSLLLSAGADLESTDNEGKTPLMLSAQKGHAECVDALLKAGAKTCAKTSGGYWKGASALMLAATDFEESQGRVACLESLAKGGAHMEAKDESGKTALMVAAESGAAKELATLLALGADIEARDSYLNTALILAAKRGKSECAALLIKAGVDVDARGPCGMTALDRILLQYTSLNTGFERFLAMLLDAGAKFDHLYDSAGRLCYRNEWQGLERCRELIEVAAERRALADSCPASVVPRRLPLRV